MNNRILNLGVVVSVLAASILASAADVLETVAETAAEDLRKATSELAAARTAVEAERLPIARRITELEQALTSRRAELAKLQRFQENQLVELNALKAEAKRLSEEVKYADSLLTEYARAFRTRLNFVEEPLYAPTLDAIDKAGSSAELAPADRFAERSKLFATSLKRMDAMLGGDLIEARALDQQGMVRSGKAALFGPVAVFASGGTPAAGLLQQELNKSDSSIAKLDKPLENAARQLVTTGSGDLVMDPTMGNAFKLSHLNQGIVEQFKKGGIAIVPLLVLGAAALLLAFYKWYQLGQVRLAKESDLQTVLKFVEARQYDEALRHARSVPGLAGQLLATAVEHVDEKKEYIEEVLYEKMLGARTKLERGLSFLALAATTGPLLGLLGTVTGMIATFKIISSFGGGDPKMLAAGISEALICTATGMGIAIPALLFHAFLTRRARSILGSMEQLAVGFVNGVPDRETSPFGR